MSDNDLAPITLALHAARHIADRTTQMHIDALWQAKSDPDEARWMLHRLSTEREHAQRALLDTLESGWWDRAGIQDIAHTYEQGRIWSRDDPEIDRLVNNMLYTIRRRFELDDDPVLSR
ncbi:hypothetical protein [Rathayibacter sp. VKM Ac-2857]|uniref:hypothetical protein n=1 Tax=Rathayibacter sp. VKM Ac-2857 TaxID=2739020 RepID=UPI001566D067|nr:hypothetical protein [Rathayibacter sp. VKM Ac-2857]NQX17994.1 hypothetical protein [Rathayibacter sp. VKM Ac-2857]